MQNLSEVASQKEKEWKRQEKKGNMEEGGYNLTVVKHQGTKCKVKKKNHNAKKPTTKKPQIPHLIFPEASIVCFLWLFGTHEI